MAQTLEDLLASYEDFELAFLYRYKMNSYLEDTSNDIKAYISSRELTEEKMEALIEMVNHSKVTDKKMRCPRCKSDKLNARKVEVNVTSGRVAIYDGMAGVATYSRETACDVCGFYLSDPNDNEKRSRFSIIDLFKQLFRR